MGTLLPCFAGASEYFAVSLSPDPAARHDCQWQGLHRYDRGQCTRIVGRHESGLEAKYLLHWARRLRIISPEGKLKHLAVRTPERITNLGLGNPDGKTLYITGRTGELYRIQLKIAGIRA